MSNRPRGRHRVSSKRRVTRVSKPYKMPDLSLYPFPGVLETFVAAIKNDQWYVAALSLKEMIEMILDG